MAALGDLLYRGSSVWKRLVGNTTTTRKFLAQTGDGVNSAAPVLVQPTEADLSLADNTTNNVSITKHGFAPKAPNSATVYLDGTGAYSTPAGTGTGSVTNTGTLTSGKLIQGNGGVDVTVNATTATVTKLTSGVPSAATDGVDYLSPATGMVRLAQIVTAGSQATVDFTSISGAYASLLVTWITQDTDAGTSASSSYLKVNNDGTSGNYTAASRMTSQNATSTPGAAVAATANGLYSFDLPNSGNTNIAGTGHTLITGYANTVFHKSIRTEYHCDSTSFLVVGHTAGRWKSTAAITRLTYGLNSGSFTDGSVFTLYGLP